MHSPVKGYWQSHLLQPIWYLVANISWTWLTSVRNFTWRRYWANLVRELRRRKLTRDLKHEISHPFATFCQWAARWAQGAIATTHLWYDYYKVQSFTFSIIITRCPWQCWRVQGHNDDPSLAPGGGQQRRDLVSKTRLITSSKGFTTYLEPGGERGGKRGF